MKKSINFTCILQLQQQLSLSRQIDIIFDKTFNYEGIFVDNSL